MKNSPICAEASCSVGFRRMIKRYLMIIGEKLFEIIKSLINNKKMANECFEFWNYFYNSELPKGIQHLILNSELKESIYSINYTLMSILICYD